MNNSHIALSVNGREVSAEVEPRLHLADFVREELLLTATHLGCEQGVCGACTVMKDGRPVRGCLTLAVSCNGSDISTLEAFADDPLMNAIRKAFKQHHGLQCGFCTPGMLTTAYDIVRRLPEADEPRIRKEISGNLCRCTGYQGAVNAIKHVLAHEPPAAEVIAGEGTRPQPTIPVEDSSPAEAAPASTEQAGSVTVSGVPDRIGNGVRLTRTLRLAAPAERLRVLLQDTSAVAACIPGAQLTGSGDADPVRGFIAVAIGPMVAQFDGAARVRYREEGMAGSIIGRGRDQLTRSQLDGGLEYALKPLNDAETELHLDITYRLSGLLAQVGRPAIVQQIADSLLEETTARLSARATGGKATAHASRKLGAFSLIFSALRAWISSLFRGQRQE
ncbi:MAG: 2Fe-2S iron-sulfur cluster-binding protein [Pseudomonadota bacterium]